MYDIPGFRVWFKHYRYPRVFDDIVRDNKHGAVTSSAIKNYGYNDVLFSTRDIKRLGGPALHGGVTKCYILDPDTGQVVAEGEAVCSWRDPFCHRIGRDISFGRAIKTFHSNQL